MPKCPKCASKLTKNKSLRIYSCRRHGFVRDINSPIKSYKSEESNAATTETKYSESSFRIEQRRKGDLTAYLGSLR